MENQWIEEVRRLQTENKRLEKWVDDLQSGMYINCVYCGYNYNPADSTTVPMRKQLEEHINSCSKHPLSKVQEENTNLRMELEKLKGAMQYWEGPIRCWEEE